MCHICQPSQPGHRLGHHGHDVSMELGLYPGTLPRASMATWVHAVPPSSLIGHTSTHVDMSISGMSYSIICALPPQRQNASEMATTHEALQRLICYMHAM